MTIYNDDVLELRVRFELRVGALDQKADLVSYRREGCSYLNVALTRQILKKVRLRDDLKCEKGLPDLYRWAVRQEALSVKSLSSTAPDHNGNGLYYSIIDGRSIITFCSGQGALPAAAAW